MENATSQHAPFPEYFHDGVMKEINAAVAQGKTFEFDYPKGATAFATDEGENRRLRVQAPYATTNGESVGGHAVAYYNLETGKRIITEATETTRAATAAAATTTQNQQ